MAERKTIADIVLLLASHLTLRNDLLPAVVTGVGDLLGDTPTADILVGDAQRRALWLAPHAYAVGDKCFAARQTPDAHAPWVVWASNIQGVATVGGGLGTGGLGSSPLGGA